MSASSRLEKYAVFVLQKGDVEAMSKSDYNFNLLLAIFTIGAILLGLMSIGALMMFLAAFM